MACSIEDAPCLQRGCERCERDWETKLLKQGCLVGVQVVLSMMLELASKRNDAFHRGVTVFVVETSQALQEKGLLDKDWKPSV
jgi:hypothetical protein